MRAIDGTKHEPFSTCLNGHDLTIPAAFLVAANGSRRCRECAAGDKPKPRSRGERML